MKETPTIYSYGQWKVKNPDLVEDEVTYDCPECDGDGEIECHHCGSEIICSECDGAGEIHENDLFDYYRKRSFEDIKKWRQYLNFLEIQTN